MLKTNIRNETYNEEDYGYVYYSKIKSFGLLYIRTVHNHNVFLHVFM